GQRPRGEVPAAGRPGAPAAARRSDRGGAARGCGGEPMTPREFRALFPEFSAPSWAAWNSIEDAIFGLAPDDADLVRRLTGRAALPTAQVSEFWAVKGRGGGGSRFVS